MLNSPQTSALDLTAIAQRLREVLDAARVPVTEFAEKVGTPYSTFRAYLTGSRAPSAEVLAGVFKLSGFFPSWLLTGEGPRRVDQLAGMDAHYAVSERAMAATSAEFVVIPRYNVAASAGPGAQNGHESEMRGLCFRRSWIDKKGLQASSLKVIDVCGDSMVPRLTDGDQVLIDMSQTAPKNGFAYVLLQGDDLLVKYAQLLPLGILRLSSENQTYKPYDIDLSKESGVSILGRVVASTHEW